MSVVLYTNSVSIDGPWGGGNRFTRAFNLPHLSYLAPADVNRAVLLMHNLFDRSAFEFARQYRIPIYLRINECDARKATTHVDEHLLMLSGFASGTIFVSNWLKDYFVDKGWKCNNNAVIINGVDRDIFQPCTEKTWGKTRIVTHHWSDNPMKGESLHSLIDEFVGANQETYEYTYIGRSKYNFKYSKHIQPLDGKELNEVLCANDVYVTGTQNDPAPNHVIEAITCGIPTYLCSSAPGGAAELVDKQHVLSSEEQLISVLKTRNFQQNSTKFNDWETCINEYRNFIGV